MEHVFNTTVLEWNCTVKVIEWSMYLIQSMYYKMYLSGVCISMVFEWSMNGDVLQRYLNGGTDIVLKTD